MKLPPGFKKLALWFRVKELEREFSRSEKFQKEYEKMSCSNLAEMERNYRAGLSREIERLKQDNLPFR